MAMSRSDFFSIEDFGEDNLGMHVYLESVYNHNVSLQTELDKGIHTHIIDHHALNIIHQKFLVQL